MADKPKQSPKRHARLTITIREDVLLELKIQAAKEGTSMSDLVERTIGDYLKKAEK